MIRILHLSDFHFKNKNQSDFKHVSDKIAKSLEGRHIDVIVFTGDLVHQVKSPQDFKQAANVLFGPILSTLKLSADNILIVPGNHDMSRDAEMKMVSESLDLKKNIRDLDDFCNDKQQLNASLTRFDSYLDFIKEFYADGNVSISDLYITFTRNINEKICGFIGLNSAWRCVDSVKDRGQLLYPVSFVDKSFEEIQGVDIVFCAMHHNISDFKDFIAQDIEDKIDERCHFLFTGHYHKIGINAISTSDVGLIHSIAPATFNKNDKSSQYGYSILEYNEDTYEVVGTPYFFIDDSFIKSDSRVLSIPLSEERKASNDFRKLIRKRYNDCLLSADELFVYGKNGNAGNTFLTLFKEPIIKDKSIQEILTSRKEGTRIPYNAILETNQSIILFGHNKCGKTSLLTKIQIDILNNYAKYKVLPYMLKYELYKGKRLNLSNELRQYFEKSKNGLFKLGESYTFLILIDNLDLRDEAFIDALKAGLQEFPNTRIIACCEETMLEQCALINIEDKELGKYYIHDITSKEVHQLTHSWPNISLDNKIKVEEKIMQIFNQMHIPFNYWTTSLFLWIFEKTDETNIHNNFELIKLYIDEILDRKNFVLNRNLEIEYNDLKSYLAALAEYIVTHGYIIDENELINFTEEYRNKNKKFTLEKIETINFLVDKAVIVKIDGRYTFRLKGVFEYFLAYRMVENTDFKNNILSNKNYLFAFGNEIELYSGFNKDDFETIGLVFDSIKDILSPITLREDYNDIDNRLSTKLSVTETDLKITGSIMERVLDMSPEEQQDLISIPIMPIDNSKVTPKEIVNIEASPSTMEKGIFLLSRVYRNSNVCNNDKLSDDMLNYILNGSCNLGFLLINNIRDIDSKNECDIQKLIQIVSNFMPIIIESFLYDAISQRNLIRIFDAKLRDLVSSPSGNQFKIFLILLILVDMDIKGNVKYLQEYLKYIKNKVLRYAVINKMILLSIKNSDNKVVLDYISPIIKELQVEFKEYENLQDSLSKEIENRRYREMSVRQSNIKDYRS